MYQNHIHKFDQMDQYRNKDYTLQIQKLIAVPDETTGIVIVKVPDVGVVLTSKAFVKSAMKNLLEVLQN
jgi:hypothetical protein